MIRLFIGPLILITIYSIYYDLSAGTIPEPTAPAAALVPTTTGPETVAETSPHHQGEKMYIEVEVKAGDTVLTIAERVANKPVPVSITQLVEDFAEMNEGTTPEKIQIGRTYKFPVY
ncbi:LysM peptidoglycan-binding domain-containing protein [Sutcliffiella horikoshii]|uniref:LysM peptidoglycan-binding domain-containing protein n=1 Tax=Sutcliffiella horikoshii TaxID=79883 RepID=UPI00203C95A0|nr:LysM domain-containing protein [Sutcliffiella horikoshii]MCM3617845.1 LysM peptidoglycan-binding domain-containing protein [Sutcliffiella horikoshii]